MSRPAKPTTSQRRSARVGPASAVQRDAFGRAARRARTRTLRAHSDGAASRRDDRVPSAARVQRAHERFGEVERQRAAPATGASARVGHARRPASSTASGSALSASHAPPGSGASTSAPQRFERRRASAGDVARRDRARATLSVRRVNSTGTNSKISKPGPCSTSLVSTAKPSRCPRACSVIACSSWNVPTGTMSCGGDGSAAAGRAGILGHDDDRHQLCAGDAFRPRRRRPRGCRRRARSRTRGRSPSACCGTSAPSRPAGRRVPRRAARSARRCAAAPDACRSGAARSRPACG